MARSTVGLLLAALLAAGCGESPEVEFMSGPTAGPVVSIGGALAADNEVIYRAILDRRHGTGPFCIVPTAGGDPEGSGASAAARFDRYGGEGTSVVVPLVVDEPEKASDPEILEQLSACSGYFFVGGQQSRVTRVFGTVDAPTPALMALLARHAEGAVISGSSAGAAIMSDPMIAGGTSAGALRSGAVREGDEGSGVRLEGGFDLIEGVVVDQHFLARGRIGRLVVVALDPDTPDRGIGVDENTALVVENGAGRVVGPSGAVLVDASAARRNGSGPGGEGVLIHLLGEGDVYDFGTREVIRGPGKQVVVPRPGERPGGELFDRWVLPALMVELAASADEALELEGDGHRAILRKAPGFRAVAREPGGRGEGPEGLADIPPGFGAGPFLLDLVPVEVEGPGDAPGG
jgi:cyanophycinase